MGISECGAHALRRKTRVTLYAGVDDKQERRNMDVAESRCRRQGRRGWWWSRGEGRLWKRKIGFLRERPFLSHRHQNFLAALRWSSGLQICIRLRHFRRSATFHHSKTQNISTRMSVPGHWPKQISTAGRPDSTTREKRNHDCASLRQL